MLEAENLRLIARRRAEIVRGIRAYFDGLGFTEVTTPVLIPAPAPEPHIDCPVVLKGGFLRASPEIEMKKLLGAGLDKIYQLGPCFREGEVGKYHHPEFTMLEWYRHQADYHDIADDLVGLLLALDVDLKPIELTVREAYLKYAGWDPWQQFNQDRFDFDMAAKIEPALKNLGAVLLVDYPVPAASLARLRGEVAERWEFYWDGLEIANCFSELCDADEQRRRFIAAKNERHELGESDYPLDEGFFAILPTIGKAAGVALGVDRLVMRLLGLTDIKYAII